MKCPTGLAGEEVCFAGVSAQWWWNVRMGRKVGRRWISGYVSSQGFVKPFLGQDMLFPGDNQDAYTLIHSYKDRSLGYPLFGVLWSKV